MTDIKPSLELSISRQSPYSLARDVWYVDNSYYKYSSSLQEQVHLHTSLMPLCHSTSVSFISNTLKPKWGIFSVHVSHQVVKRSLVINPRRIRFIFMCHLQSCHPKNMQVINHFYCPEWASSPQWFSLVVTAAGLMMAALIQNSAHALNWTIWAGTEEPCRIVLQGRAGSGGLSWYPMCPWTKPAVSSLIRGRMQRGGTWWATYTPLSVCMHGCKCERSEQS